MSDVSVLPPFRVTPAAIDAITSLGGAVHIGLEPGGCCGTFHAFSLVDADAPPAASLRFGCADAWLFVSPDALDAMVGTTLDHAPRLRPPRFRVTGHPDKGIVCPCRRSFGRPWPGPHQSECRCYEPMSWDADYQPPTEWARRTGWRREP